MKKKQESKPTTYFNVCELHDVKWEHEKDPHSKPWEEAEFREEAGSDLQRQSASRKGKPPPLCKHSEILAFVRIL